MLPVHFFGHREDDECPRTVMTECLGYREIQTRLCLLRGMFCGVWKLDIVCGGDKASTIDRHAHFVLEVK